MNTTIDYLEKIAPKQVGSFAYQVLYLNQFKSTGNINLRQKFNNFNPNNIHLSVVKNATFKTIDKNEFYSYLSSITSTSHIKIIGIISNNWLISLSNHIGRSSRRGMGNNLIIDRKIIDSVFGKTYNIDDEGFISISGIRIHPSDDLTNEAFLYYQPPKKTDAAITDTSLVHSDNDDRTINVFSINDIPLAKNKVSDYITQIKFR